MRLHHQLSVLAVVTAVSAAASPLAYGFDNRAPAPDTTQRAMAVQHHQNAPIWGVGLGIGAITLVASGLAIGLRNRRAVAARSAVPATRHTLPGGLATLCAIAGIAAALGITGQASAQPAAKIGKPPISVMHPLRKAPILHKRAHLVRCSPQCRRQGGCCI